MLTRNESRSLVQPWVSQAFGATDLNFTWLKALANVFFETLLLLRIPAIEIMTPYCLVCGDPIAPNFMSPDGGP